jgi:hypothetical protein
LALAVAVEVDEVLHQLLLLSVVLAVQAEGIGDSLQQQTNSLFQMLILILLSVLVAQEELL